MSTQPIDPSRCPLCEEDNNCGVVRGAGTCWCFSLRIPDDVRDRIPDALRDLACVCERCASGRRSPAEATAIMNRLAGRR